MRKLMVATALTLFAAAPALAGEYCHEKMDDAKADGGTLTPVAAAPAQASQVIEPSAFTKAKTPVKKQIAAKPRSAAPDPKVATANTAQ